MAQEDYRGPPHGQTSSYDHDLRYPPPSSYNQSYIPQPESDRYRGRNVSSSNQDASNVDPSRYSQAQKPINEAVASAFTATESSNAISPELLSQLTSQITANVIQQLQGANLPSPTFAQGSFSTAQTSEPPPSSSPPSDPIPYRASEEAAITPSSPIQAQFLHTSYGQDSPPQGRRPMSPQSQAGDTDTNEDRPTRPKGPKRISTSGDVTIIEKTWGALFTEDGQATKRLGQFLRGIAVHIIEDYEPKHSLVITPDKMQKYYEETKLPTEIYPWQTVFDDRTSSISRMFRQFEAQHHLVQERLDKRPGIPGLTPHGFEKWATLVLRAHPDDEFARLAKTALEMPISNPDDRKERFPKELSRRLFPGLPDLVIRSQLQRAMKEHCDIPLRQDSITDTETQPPPMSYRTDEPMQPAPIKADFPPARRQDSVLSPVTSRTSPPPNGFLGVSRDRKPYSNTPSETAISEDGEDMPTPQPIERERKPYVAQPGGGKTYDDFGSADYAAQTPEVKPARTMSINQGPPPELQKTRTIPIAIHQNGPESRHHRSNSLYNRDQTGRSARQRSPSLSANGDAYGHRSEGNFNYGSYPPPPASNDVAEDARRHREYEIARERNQNDRYDPARMAAYDPRDRFGGDTRSRMQSTAGLGMTGPVSHYADDDQYRPAGSYQANRDPYQPYPPNSYR